MNKELLINPQTLIKDALEKLGNPSFEILLVVDESDKLLGCLSNGDLRQYILSGGKIDGDISTAFNPKPIFIFENDYSLEVARQLFINNKDLTFTESADAFGLADMGFSSQAVFFDMDNDGDLDMYQVNQPADKKLFLLNKIPKKDYSLFRDKIYRNVNGKFIDVSKEVGISRNFGYGLSVNASDFNNDGWIDLYVANDYAEPDFMYYNNGDGTFKNVINEKLKHITQLSMGSDTGDINNDGNYSIGDAKAMADIVESLARRESFKGLLGGLGIYGPKSHRGAFIHVDTRGFKARWVSK